MNNNTIYNNSRERSTVTYPYVWWDGAFTDIELNTITEYCESQGLERAKVLGQSIDAVEKIEEVRRCDLKFHHVNENTKWIFEKLNWVLTQLNNQFYGFDLNGYDAFQYTSYNSKELGTYHWHMDMCLGNETLPVEMIEPRKLSLTLLVNDPSEFEGGEFCVNLGNEKDCTLVEMKKGRIIAFPSWVIHSVKPVTKGMRKSVVVWVTGPKFK